MRCRGLYGDLATGRRLARGIRLGQEDNLNVMARILLMVKFTFCPIRDFNELRVPKMNVILDDFESLGLLSRNYFDLLVKIIVIVLSRVCSHLTI